MIKKVSDETLFVLFVISAAAVGSSNTILPEMICLASVCMLYAGYKTEITAEK